MRAALVKDHQLLSINPCRGPSRSVNAEIIYFLRLLKDYFWLALPVLLRCDRLEGERRESVTPLTSHTDSRQNILVDISLSFTIKSCDYTIEKLILTKCLTTRIHWIHVSVGLM